MGLDIRRDANERLVGLELLRFLASVAVLVWHYQHFMFVGHIEAPVNWNRVPFRWLLAPFYIYGYTGVELFWCISGFIFTWKYGALICQAGVSFRRFVELRFSRLYPLHLATLLFVALLQWIYVSCHDQAFVYLFNDPTHFALNLFFANWWGFQSGESFNGPSWSVSAEVIIYIVFFWVTRRAGSSWQIDLLALLGFTTAAPVVKTLFGIKLAFSGAGTFFYLGALICHLYRWVETLGARWRNIIAYGCVGMIVMLVVLVDARMLKIAGASLLMFPGIILLVQLVVRPQAPLPKAWLICLGNLTYASYMLHFPMQIAIMLVLGMLSVPAELIFYSDWFLLGYLGAVLAASFAVFHWFERPVQAWLRGHGQG